MKKELQDELYAKYPLLYKDRTKSASKSCMSWGIAVGDGWFKIIDELSAKLEDIIKTCDMKTCVCGHSGLPYHASELKTALGASAVTYIGKPRVQHSDCNIEDCVCEKFESNHPCAAQVKEKFGSLRFYLDHGTEEMYEHIHAAEDASGKTCEECGEVATLDNSNFWVKTLCDACKQKRAELKAQQNKI